MGLSPDNHEWGMYGASPDLWGERDLGPCRWPGCTDKATLAFEVEFGGALRGGKTFLEPCVEQIGMCSDHMRRVSGSPDSLLVGISIPEVAVK